MEAVSMAKGKLKRKRTPKVALPETVDTKLIPAVDLPVEHQKLIEHLLQLNRPVSINVDVENSFSDGLVPSNNIVGEIKGAIHPEEVVVVGAHLDSWDLGTGATDDSFGAAAVLGAAQALVRADLHPERTIRFVLFTGEEEELLGSRAYVRQQTAEISNMVAAFALDWGAGPIVQLPTAGHPELLPLLTHFNEMTAHLELKPPTDGWLFMTDAYAFTLEGLPGIFGWYDHRDIPCSKCLDYGLFRNECDAHLSHRQSPRKRRCHTLLGRALFEHRL
jgi:Zn-dependent M28 family amino/carboxypeptidase